MSTAPSGLFRVLAAATFGRLYIAPFLSEFHTLYPDVTVGLSLSDSIIDMIGLGNDVAIRLGDLQNSSLVATHLAGSVSLLCASTAYLRANGTPQSVEDLATHNCLQFRRNPGRNIWKFRRDNGETEVQVGSTSRPNNAFYGVFTGQIVSHVMDQILTDRPGCS